MHFIEAKDCRIPAVGLGTWRLGGRDCVRVVEQAIRLGYRHIDTAQLYGNEREVGEGVRASGITREEVFIVTKVAPENLAPGPLERSVKESLGQFAARRDRSSAAALAEHGRAAEDTIDALVQRQARRAGPSYRRLEFHRRACSMKPTNCPKSGSSATSSNAIPSSTSRK